MNTSAPHSEGWAAGSLAVILPLQSSPSSAWTENKKVLSRRYPWELTMLGRGTRMIPPQSLPSRPIIDETLRSTLSPREDGYHVWVNRPPEFMARWWSTLGGDWDLFPGCFVTAVEYLSFDEPQQATYVVMHVNLNGAALDDPAAAAAFFAFPTSASSQADLGYFGSGEAARARLDHRVLGTLLCEIGVLREATYQPWQNPFVISHLVPEGAGFRDGLPSTDLSDHLAVGWPSEHTWAARMAASSNLDLVSEPPLTKDSPEASPMEAEVWRRSCNRIGGIE